MFPREKKGGEGERNRSIFGERNPFSAKIINFSNNGKNFPVE